MAVAALALAGCTKNETVAVADSNVIGFANAFVGNPTKAVTEINGENIEHFFVYGGYETTENVFTNVKVSKVTNAWTYDDQKQWVDEQTYKFAAYYADEALTPTTNVSFDYTSGHLTLKDIVVNPTNQVDLLYATAEEQSGPANTVRPKIEFSFDHILSMVKFTLKSGFKEGVTVAISDFKFYGMNSTATYSYQADMAWGEATVAISSDNGYALYTAEGVTKNATIEEDGTSVDAVDDCLVMPQTFNDDVVYAKFKVTLSGEGIPTDNGANVKEITAKIPADTWDAGYRYNYVATIDGQTMNYIEFDKPTVEKWEDYEAINMVNGKTSGELVKEEVEP